MPGLRRIVVNLPPNLLKEIDKLVANGEKRSRSEFICEAMRAYIEEKKRSHAREKMKRGYQEMAQLNLALAQEHCALEEEAQGIYETALGVGQY